MYHFFGLVPCSPKLTIPFNHSNLNPSTFYIRYGGKGDRPYMSQTFCHQEIFLVLISQVNMCVQHSVHKMITFFHPENAKLKLVK